MKSRIRFCIQTDRESNSHFRSHCIDATYSHAFATSIYLNENDNGKPAAKCMHAYSSLKGSILLEVFLNPFAKGLAKNCQ